MNGSDCKTANKVSDYTTQAVSNNPFQIICLDSFVITVLVFLSTKPVPKMYILYRSAVLINIDQYRYGEKSASLFCHCHSQPVLIQQLGLKNTVR